MIYNVVIRGTAVKQRITEIAVTPKIPNPVMVVKTFYFLYVNGIKLWVPNQDDKIPRSSFSYDFVMSFSELFSEDVDELAVDIYMYIRYDPNQPDFDYRKIMNSQYKIVGVEKCL